MTRPDSLRQKATAIHEAGHAVVAISHELPITSVTIQPGEDDRGRVVYPAVPDYVSDENHPEFSYDKERNYMEAHALSSFAGSIAEFEYYRVIGHPKSKGWITANRGAQSDRAEASRLIIRLASSEEEIKAYVNWLFIRTQNTVKHLLHWQAIEAVQDALLQHTLLRGKDVKEIYKEAFKIKSR